MMGERIQIETQGYHGQANPSVPPLFSRMFTRMTTGIGLLLVLVFFGLPIIKLIVLSFVSHTGISLENYAILFREGRTWTTIGNTLFLSISSTLLAIVLGVLTAWLVAYANIRGKKLMHAMILISFVIPSYVMTLSWTQFLAADGLMARMLSFLTGEVVKPWNLYSYDGMIFMLGIHHYPLVYLLSLSGFRRIPRELEWASRISGVGRWKTFFLVTLPLSVPGIVSGGLMAFLASLDNFGIPAFLGIPAHISVLSTSIYEQMTGFGPESIARAAALSGVLGVFSLVATWIQWLWLRRFKPIESVREDYEPRFYFSNFKLAVEIVVWIVLLILSFIPLLTMGFQSFLRAYGVPIRFENLTLANYEFILFENTKVQHAILNSFVLAGASVMICLVIGTGIAYLRVRKPNLVIRGVEMIVGLPYAIPGVVFALAMILAWMEPIPGWNPGIYGSMTILLLAYIGRFLILQVRGSMTAMMQVDQYVEEAAHISGASRFYKWKKVLIPLMLPGILNGVLLVFLTALTELTVSSILWSSGTETIGVVIFNFEQAGSTKYSTALSNLIVFVMVISAICYFSFNVRKRKEHKR
ncbi:MAG TPA: iron ABC transporter permease [Bacillota bacterium]|nr:iron ABC transporter permease [Bacillota bacterium]